MLHRALALPLHRTVHLGGPVLLQGPRGSGKSTLLHREFPAHTYVSFQDPHDRARARAAPNAFLDRLRGPAILDDLHRVPELTAHLASQPETRPLLLASSRRLTLPIPTLELHQPTRAELARRTPMALETLGRFAPAPAAAAGPPASPAWPPSHQFLQADVRDLIHVHDIDRFEAFLLTAHSHSGSHLDQQALARATGVSHRTAVRWLEVLHACFLTLYLPPAESAYGRRLVRAPKIHFLQGGPFPSEVVSEIYRNACHAGLTPTLRYWRDSNGFEIPLVIQEESTTPVPVEIDPDPTPAHVDRLRRWMAIAGVRNAALISRRPSPGRAGGILSYGIDQL